MTSAHLRTRSWSSPQMEEAFGDRAALQHALAFETEFARAKTKAGLIPAAYADEIEKACAALVVEPAVLAEEAAFAGTLAIPLIARIRQTLSPEACRALHTGATSQDLADTVMALQIKEAGQLIAGAGDRITLALEALALRYSETPAIGRTLMQDAQAIGFGLRAAQWRRGLSDALVRLQSDVKRAARLQLGGAAGSRSGLGGVGAEVAEELASKLGLPTAPPWHARRGEIAALGSSIAILIGALGKMARDVALLSQSAVAEAHEPRLAGRGGSSAMPHKRNPTTCQIALSAAIRSPGLAATLIAALPQEMERGLGGWQAEAPVLAELFLLAAGSLEAMAGVAGGLEVDPERIAENLRLAGFDGDLGESRALVAELLRDAEQEI